VHDGCTTTDNYDITKKTTARLACETTDNSIQAKSMRSKEVEYFNGAKIKYKSMAL
jgi:ribosomal protein L44E